MPKDSLVPISLDGFVAFFGFLAAVMFVLFWYIRRQEKRARDAFFGQYDEADLRMSPHQIGLVYRVAAIDGEVVTVVPIWRGKAPFVGGAEQTVRTDDLIPFNAARFF